MHDSRRAGCGDGWCWCRRRFGPRDARLRRLHRLPAASVPGRFGIASPRLPVASVSPLLGFRSLRYRLSSASGRFGIRSLRHRLSPASGPPGTGLPRACLAGRVAAWPIRCRASLAFGPVGVRPWASGRLGIRSFRHRALLGYRSRWRPALRHLTLLAPGLPRFSAVLAPGRLARSGAWSACSWLIWYRASPASGSFGTGPPWLPVPSAPALTGFRPPGHRAASRLPRWARGRLAHSVPGLLGIRCCWRPSLGIRSPGHPVLSAPGSPRLPVPVAPGPGHPVALVFSPRAPGLPGLAVPLVPAPGPPVALACGSSSAPGFLGAGAPRLSVVLDFLMPWRSAPLGVRPPPPRPPSRP